MNVLVALHISLQVSVGASGLVYVLVSSCLHLLEAAPWIPCSYSSGLEAGITHGSEGVDAKCQPPILGAAPLELAHRFFGRGASFLRARHLAFVHAGFVWPLLDCIGHIHRCAPGSFHLVDA